MVRAPHSGVAPAAWVLFLAASAAVLPGPGMFGAPGDGAAVAPSAPAALELDHAFTVVAAGGGAAQALEQVGLFRFPEPTVHQGQGTASFIIPFDNAYLELIWVEDAEVLRQADLELAARLGLDAPDASPFGIALRRAAESASRAAMAFETRPYRAEWMGADPAILFAKGLPTAEPLLFVMPAEMAWLRLPKEVREGFEHPNGARRLTGLRLLGPDLGEPSPALAATADETALEVAAAARHLIEIELDGGRSGERHDLRPTLPWIVRR